MGTTGQKRNSKFEENYKSTWRPNYEEFDSKYKFNVFDNEIIDVPCVPTPVSYTHLLMIKLK